MALKSASTGQVYYPAQPAIGTAVTSGAANVFTTTAVQMIASTAAAVFITGVHVNASTVNKPTYMTVQIGTGPSVETTVGQVMVPVAYSIAAVGTVVAGYRPIWPWIAVATATRIAVKTADSIGATPWLVSLEYINQANVVDAGVVEAVNATQLAGQTITAAAGVTFPSSVASPTNITAATGITVSTNSDKTGYSLAVGQKVDVDTIKTNPVVNAGTVTFPTNATLASTTNLTAGTVATVTNAVTLPSIPANWITAAGITAAALNGKGDWNIGKTGYSLTQTFPTNFSSLLISATGHISIVDTATAVTNAVTLPSIPANWITAAGITAAALNGKGDWNIGKTGYSLTQAFPANFSVLGISGAGAINTVTTLTGPVSVDTTLLMKTSQYSAPANALIRRLRRSK